MDNLITEFWKIKRYSVIKAGAAMMFLSVFMSYSNFAHRFNLCTLKIQYLAVIQLS